MRSRFQLSALALALAACGEMAKLPADAGMGPNPQLPQPNRTLIPTVRLAPQVWPQGRATPAPGLAVTEVRLRRPRSSALAARAAQRDVLVASRNAPPKEDSADQGLGDE